MTSEPKKEVEDSRAWKVCTFGELRVFLRCQLLPAFSNRKVAQLLLLLASKADRPVSRDLVAETLWPGEYLEIAKDRLRQTLSLLNKHFRDSGAEGPIDATRTTICLSTSDCEIDLVEFHNLLHQTTSEHHCLIEAIKLAEKPIGEGFVEDWIRDIRESTIATAVSRLRSAIAVLKEQGDLGTLIKVCEAGINLAPMDDGFNFERFTALIDLGRQSDALIVRKTFEEKLQQQFGLEPSSRWSEQSFEFAKDSPNPWKGQEWISLSQPVDRFFGRESEIERLNTIFNPHSNARLATITGQGGAGKTRLSLEFIRQLDNDAFDRVIAIGLAEFDSVGQVAHAIADAFEVVLFHEAGLSGLVASMISNSRTLIVFDNCEHLLHEVTPMVRTLVTECPTLSVLCSSRMKLGIHGERELALEPLELSADAGNPVVQLLIDRIRAHDHAYSPDQVELTELVKLGQLLEGVPLALELAASQTGLFSVRELRKSLQGRVIDLANKNLDMPERHHALRNTLTWGFEHLNEKCRTALRQMSIFPGPWSLADATALLNMDDLIAVHEQLLGATMIKMVPNSSPKQFRMLEMVRQFVGDFLTEADTFDLKIRHVDIFRDKAFGLHNNILAVDQRKRVSEFRSDLPHYRLAIQTGLREYEHVKGLSLLILRTSLLAEPAGLLYEWAEYAKLAAELPRTQNSERGILLAFICHTQALHGTTRGHEALLQEVLDLVRLESSAYRRSYMVNLACNLIASKEYVDFIEPGLAELEVAARLCEDAVHAVNHLLSKAQLLNLNGNFGLAEEVLLAAIGDADRLGAIREFLWTNVRLAEIYLMNGHTKKSVERVLTIAERFNETDDRFINVWLAKILILAAEHENKPEKLTLQHGILIVYEETRRHQFSITFTPKDVEQLRQAKRSCQSVLLSDFELAATNGANLNEREARNLVESIAREF